MGAAGSVNADGTKKVVTDDELNSMLEKCKKVAEENPGNLAMKYACEEGGAYAKSLSAEDRLDFFLCIKTGLENPTSGLGCYAMTPSDYTKYAPFFNKVLGDYHLGDPAKSKVHETDWDLSKVGEEGIIDLRKLGLDKELSMRVRVGRNLTGFNLPGKMDQAERIKFEIRMLEAFKPIIAAKGGKINSLTPDFGKNEDGSIIPNPNLIDEKAYQELVDAHVMFKDMAADSFLASAGIASDWPYGRGCWQSEDKSLIIWFGEEDQLRIMCMKKGFFLNEVFDGLSELLKLVESVEGIKFATDDNLGYVTSCPSNLGTGMRASVHIALPNLTSDGTDAKAKEVCNPLALSVRGTGGEHTPIGKDGTVDISPRARLYIKESEIVAKLFEGLRTLLEAEKAAASA